MPRLILCFLYLLYWHPASCNTWEVNFSELDWENTTNWWGDKDKFYINSGGRLLLSDPAPGSANSARLFSKQSLDASQEIHWEFDLFFPFNPSTSNHFVAGLYTELPAGNSYPDGYYLQVGGQSGEDLAELFFRQGTQKTIICQLQLSWLDNPNQVLRFGVTAKEGKWKIEICASDKHCYYSEECSAGFFPDGKSYFSLNFRYTPSRNQAISIAYVSMKNILPDLNPPELLQLSLEKDSILKLLFSEPIQKPGSNEAVKLSLQNSALDCNVNHHPDNPLVWQISCSEPLQYDQSYRLQITTFLDAFNNSGHTDTFFSFSRPFIADFGDLVINEIMSDPHPPEGLPNAEYIEIKNILPFSVDLQGWEVQVNQQRADLSAYTLSPKGLLLLFPQNSYENHPGVHHTGLPDFPGLPNNGAYIALLQNGRVIDALEYHPAWYGKKIPSGGISLEKKVPTLLGNCPLNWQASEALNGGTPATDNSHPRFAYTDSLFFAERLYLPESEVMEIGFSQIPLLEENASVADFKTIPPIPILAFETLENPLRALRLYFGDSLKAKTTYQLFLPQALSNCLGAPTTGERLLVFALPKKPEAKKLVINEILFDPAVGQEVFVELYNSSKDYLDLRDLVFRIFDPEKQLFSYFIPELPTQLAPDSFLVLSPDRLVLQQFFPQTPLSNCLDSSLPNFPRERGSLSLWHENKLIDSISFDQNWHHPFLSSKRGISLEKIAPDRSGTEAGSWVSGSEATGFATPGLPNAAVLPRQLNQNNKKYPLLHLSPDGDGIDDFLWIRPETQYTNSLYNASIFSWDGFMIKPIAERQIITADSYIRWDGDDRYGQPVSRGLYILRIEIYNPEGHYALVRRACLLW